MSPEAIGAVEIIGVVVGSVGVLFAILAWRSAARGNRTAREAFDFAKKQAALSPKLKVYVDFIRNDISRDVAYLEVRIKNFGERPATNMHGWIVFSPANFERPKKPSTDVERMVSAYRGSQEVRGVFFSHSNRPNDEGMYVATLYNDRPHIPGTTHLYTVSGRIRQTGCFPVHVTITSSEGILYDRATNLNIPEHLGPR